LSNWRVADLSQSGEEYATEVARLAAGRAKARSLRPLRRLLPFLKPYRLSIAAALIALIASSSASLLIPPAIRGMIDHGFNRADADRIGRYFLALIGVAAVLGLATAIRFYFVTWLGERVIADIRKAVFDHVLSLTPSFFEITRTGEVLSRLTADTTLIQTVVGSSASIAARNSSARFSILVRFQESASAASLAISWVFDSITVSRMRRRLARRLDPVSVTSTMPSASTGGFTSVAPQENSTLTGTFFVSK